MQSTVSCYEVMTNTDTVEGRGAIVGTGILFDNEASALQFVCSPRYKKYGQMGTYPSTTDRARYHIRKRESKTIYSSVEEWEEDQVPDLSGQVREIDGRKYRLFLAQE